MKVAKSFDFQLSTPGTKAIAGTGRNQLNKQRFSTGRCFLMYLKEPQIELIKTYLQEQIAPYLIIIFGSALTGKMLPDSDIDIAFLAEQKFSAYKLFMIGQHLADKLGRDVDLVDLNTASTVFQARVLTTGKVIYCTDETKRMLFYMLTLKKYARLNEERKQIIDRIAIRGTRYDQ
ncbi:putative nucleotidyltransferase [Desulfoscipio gibsoniae DSM 7213]|uniref:Putative nucleotidyltransferase n=2 Tax=Desulfoscipio gibsoniae TaxID=102134 RepID=R4KQN0_9FIRM|nr:putative nucleotidyltransferase [Desulfoscipio gibsoniae DSM 7213]